MSTRPLTSAERAALPDGPVFPASEADHLRTENARLRARLAGRPTPPTHAEVAALTARCGHRQALRASVWLVACGDAGMVVLLCAEDDGTIPITSEGCARPMAVVGDHYGITRWWPLDGATLEPTDWPDVA